MNNRVIEIFNIITLLTKDIDIKTYSIVIKAAIDLKNFDLVLDE
jgi:hypothetical protein